MTRLQSIDVIIRKEYYISIMIIVEVENIMGLEANFKKYKSEIELIESQNRVECDLYSIIADLIRSSKQSENISLRDVSSRRRTDFSNRFIGDSGFPDFVIRTREMNNDAKVLGAIEVKYITENLDLEKHLEQLSGHIYSYKQVIYTNGLVWRFYKLDRYKKDGEPVWKIILAEEMKGRIEWKCDNEWNKLLKELDDIDWISQK